MKKPKKYICRIKHNVNYSNAEKVEGIFLVYFVTFMFFYSDFFSFFIYLFIFCDILK